MDSKLHVCMTSPSLMLILGWNHISGKTLRIRGPSYMYSEEGEGWGGGL